MGVCGECGIGNWKVKLELLTWENGPGCATPSPCLRSFSNISSCRLSSATPVVMQIFVLSYCHCIFQSEVLWQDGSFFPYTCIGLLFYIMCFPATFSQIPTDRPRLLGAQLYRWFYPEVIRVDILFIYHEFQINWCMLMQLDWSPDPLSFDLVRVNARIKKCARRAQCFGGFFA